MTLFALGGAPGCAQDDAYRLAGFEVEVRGDRLLVRGSSGALLLDSGEPGGDGALLAWREATAQVKSAFGMYQFSETAPAWTRGDRLSIRGAEDGRLVLAAGAGQVALEAVEDGVLRLTLTPPADARANRVRAGFVCEPGQRFHGLGALVHGTEHRGESVPCWVSEQGIGKLRRKNPYDGFPLKGDIHDSYLPVPFVLLGAGAGLLAEQTHRTLFHMCSGDAPGRFRVETWTGTLSLVLLDGPAPTRVVERLTRRTGRPRMLPPWALGPWIDATHGQQKVLDVANRLRKQRIPASAIWTEDWIGGEDKLGGYHLKYQWHADTTLYPDLRGLTGTLRAQGLRFLGYFNPFLEQGRKQWSEARARGYGIVDADGKPLSFTDALMAEATLPDLTDEGAVKWLQGYLSQALDLGLSGWMADYAEWLPVEARLADGRDGLAAHNVYPLQWQRAHRELLDRELPDGDYVFFVRSGWAGTGGLAPVVWAGDQQTEFGGLDGMQTVIPLIVNAGLSGIPIMTHDIAGYSTYGDGVIPTTRELFFRWTELGAYTSIMRTHHGAMADKNWSWDRDAATIAHFRAYARRHTALYPYRALLVRQASSRGLPLMRHLALHYPDDARVARIKDQFLLGPSLLVAPVQVDGAREREVYLPGQGSWYPYAGGGKLAGGRAHTIKAGLTEIPVFAPAGAIVPELTVVPDTLARATDGGVVDLDDARAGGLTLRVFLGRDGELTLADGALVALTDLGAVPGGDPGVTLEGVKLGACGGGTAERCFDADSGTLTIYTGAVQSAKLTVHNGLDPSFELRIGGGKGARRYRVVARW